MSFPSVGSRPKPAGPSAFWRTLLHTITSAMGLWDAVAKGGTDIASASTINLTTATGPILNLVGTTTVTAVTLASQSVRIVRATGAVPFTASATLVVNGSTTLSYTCTAGDILIFEGLASGVAVSVISAAVRPVTVIRTQVFTSSGTYTPTAGMVYCEIWALGGGGGGGGCSGNASASYGAGGGGAGALAYVVATKATIGASQTVTIGGAGAGGSAGNNNGSAGGDTSVGSICIAKGGSGGGYGSAGGPGAGGAGGTWAGAGAVLGTGEPGGGGNYLATSSFTIAGQGGKGGSTMFGGGGNGAMAILTVTAGGLPASGSYGAGGGGAAVGASTSTPAGAAGNAGLILIIEHCA